MVTPQQTIVPCAPPPKRTVQENTARTYLADASLQEGASEAEAIEAQAHTIAEERIKVSSTTHFVHVGWDTSIFF